MNKIKPHSRLLVAIFLSLILLVLTMRGSIGNFNNTNNLMEGLSNPAFESPHERSSYMLLLSMIYDNSIELSTPLADFGFNDIGMYQSKLYSLFPPGVSLAISPLFFIGTFFDIAQLLSYFTVIVFSILNLCLIYLICLKIFSLPKKVSVISGFIYLFGTTAWSYAVTIYQHTFTTFIMLASVYAVCMFIKEKRWSWGITAGALYLMSVAFDYTNMVILFPIVFFMFLFAKKVPGLFGYTNKLNYIFPVILLILVMAIPLIYNQYVFGDWKVFSNSLPVYKIDDMNTSVDPLDKSLGRFNDDLTFKGIKTLLISYENGLFLYSPILLLGLLYILIIFIRARDDFQIKKETLLLISLFVINIALYSVFNDPRGGASYGARYLIPSMAILSILIGNWLVMDNFSKFKKIILYIGFVVSSAFACIGVLATNMVSWQSPLYDLYSLPHGVVFNINFFFLDKSGSFIYNHFLSQHLSVILYSIIVYALTIIFFVAVTVFDFEKKS